MKKPKLKQTSKWSTKKPLYIEKTEKGYNNHLMQLKENGFCDAETWNLDGVISEFILPRLKRFKEVNICYPHDLTPAKWNEILDKIIFAFEWNIMCDIVDDHRKLSIKEEAINWKKHKDGMQLFVKYFRNLWW